MELFWYQRRCAERRCSGASTPLSDPLTTSNSETVTHQYDGYGNRTLTIDALTNQTEYEYEAINGFTGLYLTRVTRAYGTSVARKQEYGYDFWTGVVTLDKDADNGVSTTTQYDKLGRPTLISRVYPPGPNRLPSCISKRVTGLR